MMSQQVVFDIVEDKQNGSHRAFYPEATVRTAKDPGDGPSRVEFEPDYTAAGKDWAPWGKKDNFPTDVRCKIEKVPLAGQAVGKLAGMLYGSGLVYYRNEDLYDQDAEVSPVYMEEVHDWLRRNRIQRWALGQIMDYRYYMNAFSEMIFRNDKGYISRIHHKPAEFCRLEKQNERTLNIERLYYSDYFAGSTRPKEDQIVKLPLFNWEQQEEFLERHRGHTMAYHTKFPTPGHKYYSRPLWVGLFRDSGWLDVSANVPEIVNAMFRNQMTVKYQVIFPERYFNNRHPDWDNLDEAKKGELYRKKADEIDEYLSGTKDAYKSISQMVASDPMSRDGQDSWADQIRIIPIDDKMKKGVYIPDSQAADSQIVQGLGIHPSQMGLQPEGGKMGGGSGSDQRESYNTQISLNTADQHIILEPLNFISWFNGWGVTFLFNNRRHVTLDQNRTGIDQSNQNPAVQ